MSVKLYHNGHAEKRKQSEGANKNPKIENVTHLEAQESDDAVNKTRLVLVLRLIGGEDEYVQGPISYLLGRRILVVSP